MTSLVQFSRTNNYLIGCIKNILHGRTVIRSTQVCYYTKKSAEQKLGIEKPKRPLTPFFKFMTQMRPALLAKNPGISSKEAITWTSKHWQQLDTEAKSQLMKEYEKDMEDYKKIKALYDSSLTDQQKQDIKRVQQEMNEAKEQRKLRAEYREMGRPKKPMSSYLIFSTSRKDLFAGNDLKEFQQKVKTEWLKLSASERTKYEKQAQQLMDKYKKDIEAWELKMISIGRSDLVRAKPAREKKRRSEKSKE